LIPDELTPQQVTEEPAYYEHFDERALLEEDEDDD